MIDKQIFNMKYGGDKEIKDHLRRHKMCKGGNLMLVPAFILSNDNEYAS